MSSVSPGFGSDPEPEDELELSPSETMAHNSAMRISGAAKGQRSTQRALASIVLGFELIIVVLIGLTIFGLGITEPRELGLYLGGGLAVVILVALAIMRRGKVGIYLGWAVHGLMLLSAIILPMALVVGVLFTALWVYCMVKGAQLDRQRAAWIAEHSDPS
ncbi:DUF4233 domain-containing protein [Leucobacter coleopterorum]|uniref:DUF4233 domain-containing protein n=1 Tax=Leucobacter coleopterorum TaxID=2714933 RepID=A0ABX6K042_9MICO|nr:DUF4233 domain-containing protein [Leucobacter coleopterorum]QIM18449.1 DUF4233 domain-containing protein [Leucobacter coleopterorum]